MPIKDFPLSDDLAQAKMAIDTPTDIPSPPGLPFIGTLLEEQDEIPAHGISRLMDVYGPIIKLNAMGRERVVVGSVDLLEEICDEKRFWKSPAASKNHGNRTGRNGLFTAPSEDSLDWQLAHRILMPAFGPLAIEQMFGEMHDIASQMILKWARMGASHAIEVTTDFTKLTLDTISLCAMDYRFNSFYQDELHPFIKAMNNTFSANQQRRKVTTMVQMMLPWDNTIEKIKLDRQFMGKVAMEMVQARRQSPSHKKDLLNAMINGVDPKSGKSMDNALIVANMVTFLVAGHETTSGLLSFAMLELLKKPEAYFKVQQEVDRVLGRGQMTAKHLKDLKYINAVMRETLRLNPTVPSFSRSIRPDNPNDIESVSGGKYAIRRSDNVQCSIYKAHRDPRVYGEDALEFKPERMLDEHFTQLPNSAWKPFGSGMRACIGRAFAWQEAQMVLALLFQNFKFRLSDPAYEKRVKQATTMKPEGLYIHATLREGITTSNLASTLVGSSTMTNKDDHDVTAMVDCGVAEEEPMTILYGSNTGTCQSLAQRLSVEAHRMGFRAEVKDLNTAVESLSKHQPIAIITPSYEGQPPDNADQFVGWLQSMSTDTELSGISYAVFGCGHSDWRSTFQRIPTLIDELMSDRGAKRLAARGSTDASQGNIFSDFDKWTDHTFWPVVAPDSAKSLGDSNAFEVKLSSQDRATYLGQDVRPAVVNDVRTLTGDGEPEKRHLEVKLPDGMTYSTGDYLAILPLTPIENVQRAMRHFELAEDATVNIKPAVATFLPTGVTIAIRDLLRGFVELAQPATRKDVQVCQAAASSAKDKTAMQVFIDKDGYAQIVDQRVSLLDLTCRYASIRLSFSTFLSMLPPLRPRHYSISSSSLSDPGNCAITYGVQNEAARSGTGRHLGVASAYMAGLAPGDALLVTVRSTNKYFRLPTDPRTPIIMFGAGTGIAPFRAFIEERATQIAAGRSVAPAIMWMGCRSSSRDRLYADMMDEWVKIGAVDVRYAFSREPAKSEGCRYVQERILRDREDVLRLWRQGAKCFVCGSPAVSDSCGKAAKRILEEILRSKGEEVTERRMDEFFRAQRNERFVVDVFD